MKMDVILTLGRYTLINRNTNIKPYVAASRFDPATQSWANGRYFESQEDALLYILRKENPEGIIDAAIDLCYEVGRSDIGKILEGMNYYEEFWNRCISGSL